MQKSIGYRKSERGNFIILLLRLNFYTFVGNLQVRQWIKRNPRNTEKYRQT